MTMMRTTVASKAVMGESGNSAANNLVPAWRISDGRYAKSFEHMTLFTAPQERVQRHLHMREGDSHMQSLLLEVPGAEAAHGEWEGVRARTLVRVPGGEEAGLGLSALAGGEIGDPQR
jgi:hypothetical protein